MVQFHIRRVADAKSPVAVNNLAKAWHLRLRLRDATAAEQQDVVRLFLKKYPEGPPLIRQALLVCKKVLHFAKSGGAVYNDHVRAQPMARLKRLEIGKRTLVLIQI